MIMTKQSFAPLRIYTFIAALVALLLSPAAVRAQDGNGLPIVSYLGREKGQPLVQVDFENGATASCRMVLQDPDGNTLYYTRFSDRSFSKKFLIQANEGEDVHLFVVLFVGKQRHAQEVKITRNSFVKEEVSVTKR